MVAVVTSVISFSATAVDLETLVMPGPVIELHADIEADCRQCHTPFARGQQRALCLACHKDVGKDMRDKGGFHGRSERARADECAACHTEHEGRAANVIGLEPDNFNHRLADFHLDGAHLETACEECHVPAKKHRDAPLLCFDCHTGDDEHEGGLGTECESCHQTTAWPDTGYDHGKETGYALTGKHGDTGCVSCHVKHNYQDTPTECYGCHRSDDTHEGLNGEDCAFCHVSRSWQESLFDHTAQTDFPLLGRHDEIACVDCHVGNKFETKNEPTCIGCHRQDDEHEGLNGETCGDCHDATQWSAVSFDHALDAGFPLRGQHGEIACTACHTAPVHEVETGSACIDCHGNDDPHADQLGQSCGDCHNEQDWKTVVVFDHGLTEFPLIGQHRQTDCGQCHETARFRDASTDCRGCHRAEDSHKGRLGATCESCHSPADWSFWTFDHNSQTEYALDGAHLDLYCEACHTRAGEDVLQLPQACISCHRGDDVHRGDFGRDCERCHTTQSFHAIDGGRR
jgi:hypothetical protein